LPFSVEPTFYAFSFGLESDMFVVIAIRSNSELYVAKYDIRLLPPHTHGSFCRTTINISCMVENVEIAHA